MSVAAYLLCLGGAVSLFCLGGAVVALLAGQVTLSALKAAQSARRAVKELEASVSEAVDRLEQAHQLSRTALTAEHAAAVKTLATLVRVNGEIEDRS